MELQQPYIVLVPTPTGCTAYVHAKSGQGKYSRRFLVGTFHLETAPHAELLSTALRELATQFDLPPSERWSPAL
jgi:hypothetical protein